MTILAVDTYLYVEAKNKDEESSEFNTESDFNKALESLLSKQKETSLSPAELYQLASMQHRQANDNKIRKEAAREVRYTAIDLGAYFFIAAASCSAITAYYFSAPIQAIIGNAALAATIIGVTIATAAKAWKSRAAIAKAVIAIHEWCNENIYSPIHEWCKENIYIPIYEWGKEKMLNIFKQYKNMTAETKTKNIQYETLTSDIPSDASDCHLSGDHSLDFSLKKTPSTLTTILAMQENDLTAGHVSDISPESNLAKKDEETTPVITIVKTKQSTTPKSISTSPLATFSPPTKNVDNTHSKKTLSTSPVTQSNF
jgi:hypothetical protein